MGILESVEGCCNKFEVVDVGICLVCIWPIHSDITLSFSIVYSSGVRVCSISGLQCPWSFLWLQPYSLSSNSVVILRYISSMLTYGVLTMQIPAVLVREYCITMTIVISCLKVKKSEEWSFVICTAMVLFDRRKSLSGVVLNC